MKRSISLLLALCLALTLAVPALADAPAGMEDALTEITLHVKEALGVEDDYTEFYSNYNDGLRPGWYLNWSADGREVSCTCDENGVITDAYVWGGGDNGSGFYGFDAAFPALTREEAAAEAEAWLERLMPEGQTGRIDRDDVTLLRGGDHCFTGRVLMNGLESPVRFTLRINDGGLSAYSRTDGYAAYLGELPGSESAVTAEEAARALREAAALELYYVTDGSEARLRYVPVGPYTLVDARTGEAVDMEALYASFGGSAQNGEMPAAEASYALGDAGRGLTEVELSSIQSYGDALDRDALDQAARALPMMGLEDFQLIRCSYAMDRDGGVTANLRYRAEITEDRLFGFSRETYEDYIAWGDTPMVYKYVTLDALDGSLRSLSTDCSLWEDGPDRLMATDHDADPAEVFLKAAAPERLEQAALCELKAAGQGPGETFARVHDGYFFPENYLYVYVNPRTETVDEFSFEWDEDVSFAPSEGIVDMDAAMDAYTDALDVTLGYAAWPEAIDYADPVFDTYISWGYTFVESLRLGWYYSEIGRPEGVDALTGRPITGSGDGAFSYEDLTGDDRAGMIRALGDAGVGLEGGLFRAGDPLTMADAARLLLRAAGFDLTSWGEDTLADMARQQGFVRDAWEARRELTRMEFLRMLLGASRYGAAAEELTGVWKTDFEDVSETDAGYAAAAQALGLAQGNTFAPEDVCTRGDGAELLYRFMAR